MKSSPSSLARETGVTFALVFVLAACGASKGGANAGASGADANAGSSGADAMADATRGAGDASVGPTPDGVEDAMPTPVLCLPGQVPDADGACVPVGIRGCAELFIDPTDGLCKPSMDHCPLGQTPIFSEGCQPVGIPDCHPDFIDPETGLCDPSPEHCPAGQVPSFSEGCQPVGVVDCHPDFIDPESGHCDPDPDACAPNHIPVPTQGCVSLDPPGGCGDGTWGGVEALDGDVHVDIAFAGGASDGSREAPFTVIKDATDVVQAGGRVILAAGDYPEGVRLTKSFELVGRCSSMVIISGAKPTVVGPDAVIRANGAVEAGLRNLTLSGPGLGILVYDAATLDISRVALVENQGGGILAALPGVSVSATGLLVARTQPFVDGTGGRGIEVQEGAALTLDSASVVENYGAGLMVTDAGTTASAHDILVARTMVRADGTGGEGIAGQYGAAVTLERASVVDNHNRGLRAMHAETTLSVRDALVARTAMTPAGTGGRGIEVEQGVALTLERVSVVDNTDIGLVATDSGTSVDGSGVLVSGTQSSSDGSGGQGIGIADGASCTLSKASILDNHHTGLFARNDGTTVVATELLVAGTMPSDDGELIGGLSAYLGATLTVERSALVDNYGVGAQADDAGTTLMLTDSLAGHSVQLPDAALNSGALALRGAALTLESVVVTYIQGWGLFVMDVGTAVLARRSLITRNGTSPEGGVGWGGVALLGASLTLEQSAVADNREFGVMSYNAGTTVTVTESLVEGTRELNEGLYGRGIQVHDGGAVTLFGSAIMDNHEAGLIAMNAGSTAAATQSIVARTRPSAAGGQGRGVAVQTSASVALESVALVDNHEIALWIYKATGGASSSLFAGTKVSGPDGYGDGLIADQSDVFVTSVVARHNERAGILFSDSTGGIESCHAAENAIGLVTQALDEDTTLAIADDNVFEDNLQNVMSDGALEIPNQPMFVPQMNELE